jgi:hypothetical protein
LRAGPAAERVRPVVYILTVPRRRRGLHDVRLDRPRVPYLPDGTLDPREWNVACSAAYVLMAVVLRDQPWFVCARPIEVRGQGVQLEVVVRWYSDEVWEKVPVQVDGYGVDLVLEGDTAEVHTIH